MRVAACVVLALVACRREAPTATPTPTPAPIATAPSEPASEPPAVHDDAFAVVDGVALPFADFDAIYQLKVGKYRERGREIPASADRRYRKSISERLVYHEVLRQAAAKIGVTPDPARLAAREEQQKRGIVDWPNHLVRRGETDLSLREMYIAEERERLILEHRGALAITPEEIEARYQETKDELTSKQPRVRASHILVPHETPDAEARAKELHARARQPGTDFAALARETSTGPSADNGGDLGIFTADRMAEEFSKAAFALKVGEISKPVRTKFGWHIIKLTGKFGPGTLPKAALEPEIRERLGQRKLHELRRALKDELLAKAKVVNRITDALGPEPAKGAPGIVVKPIAEVGIPECDEVIRDYVECASKHPAEPARDALLAAMIEVSAAWQEGAAMPGTREQTRQMCLTFRDQIASSMTSLGCSWRQSDQRRSARLGTSAVSTSSRSR